MQPPNLQHTSESHFTDESPGIHQAAAPHQTLSSLPLSDWRGSATTFTGFTATKPANELVNAEWDVISNLVRPNKPAVIADKKQSQYVIPCLLKEAPFVANTLEAAIKNGQPTTGKMRSKQHVTEAAMLIMDIDGLPEADFMASLDRIKDDGLTFLAYTTHSHGSADKPGMRARIAMPLDRPVNAEEYASAWHGVDSLYWNGQAGKADPSGANLYQQQGTWCCDPSRVSQADSWQENGGVASADALVAMGKVALAYKNAKLGTVAKKTSTRENTVIGGNSNIENDAYPDSDANEVANNCQQIGVFRDSRGADQSEPLWRDCLGVVGFCLNGENFCHEWSGGYVGYDVRETANKLSSRMRIAPTTCAQFKKSNPVGCHGCAQGCHSPITLGWQGQTLVAGWGRHIDSDEQFQIVRDETGGIE